MEEPGPEHKDPDLQPACSRPLPTTGEGFVRGRTSTVALKTGQGLTGKNGKNEEKPSHYRISRWHKRRPRRKNLYLTWEDPWGQLTAGSKVSLAERDTWERTSEITQAEFKDLSLWKQKVVLTDSCSGQWPWQSAGAHEQHIQEWGEEEGLTEAKQPPPVVKPPQTLLLTGRGSCSTNACRPGDTTTQEYKESSKSRKAPARASDRFSWREKEKGRKQKWHQSAPLVKRCVVLLAANGLGKEKEVPVGPGRRQVLHLGLTGTHDTCYITGIWRNGPKIHLRFSKGRKCSPYSSRDSDK